jgi:hypothetical protein
MNHAIWWLIRGLAFLFLRSRGASASLALVARGAQRVDVRSALNLRAATRRRPSTFLTSWNARLWNWNLVAQ